MFEVRMLPRRRRSSSLTVVVVLPLSIVKILLKMSLFSVSRISLSAQPRQIVLQQRRWMGHSVRIILLEDLNNGKMYKNDIVTVKAGYARNYLVPQKFAVYATRENFKRFNLKDPDLETMEERRLRLEKESSDGFDVNAKAADLLRVYLRNKVVRTNFLQIYGLDDFRCSPCSQQISLCHNVCTGNRSKSSAT
jgi:Ribosomal protein L9, N-terminal domain